jgi:hypothetical protein
VLDHRATRRLTRLGHDPDDVAVELEINLDIRHQAILFTDCYRDGHLAF